MQVERKITKNGQTTNSDKKKTFMKCEFPYLKCHVPNPIMAAAHKTVYNA